ncbi:MAG: flagellin [Alphaproteobacteria bacterium]|nr:flagellin [Alphaproteobacteria bacterium]
MVQRRSILTNFGAMSALGEINATTERLQNTQLRITTGLRVNGPKDDAATFQITLRPRGDIAGTKVIRTALASGETTTNVAISAGKAIADLLIEMKAKVVQASQAGTDPAFLHALNNDFVALRDQISTIIATAEFNSLNLITSGAATTSVLSTAEGDIISVSAQSMDASTLGIAGLDLTTSVGASNALNAIDFAITSVSDKLASLGSAANRIDDQTEFTTSLIDILTAGLGNLVDADLAEEAASLTALQVQQQLGVQSLSIANAAPGTILSLFQG